MQYYDYPMTFQNALIDMVERIMSEATIDHTVSRILRVSPAGAV